MLGLLGKVITAVARPVLPFLGSVAKGKATAAGVTGLVAAAVLKQGAPFIGGVLNAENLVPAINAVANVLQAVAAIVAAFGFGRKAGAGA